MDNLGDWEQRKLLNELEQGRELAKQLQLHLSATSSSSNETQEFFVQNIVASYDKALSILNWVGQHPTGVGIRTKSPCSLSEDSDRDVKEHENIDASRKRKALPWWTQEVKVTSGMGLEGILGDGFSWRKYGQKEILGANYPRGYYRCSHRNGQGCLATKQVQRSDDDSTIFKIVYRGRHTCTQTTQLAHSTDQMHELSTTSTETQNQPQVQSQEEMILNLRAGLKVITEDLGTPAEQPLHSFNFPSTSNASHLLSSSIIGNIIPPFTSSNYLSVSSTGLINSWEQNQNFHGSGSELTEIVSAATSATSTPTVDNLSFSFGSVGLDSNFTFDNSRFF